MISKFPFPPAKIRDDPGILKTTAYFKIFPIRTPNDTKMVAHFWNHLCARRQCGEGLIISPAIRQIHISLTLLHHAPSGTMWT